MAKFDTEIIKIEGGYVNDPVDAGGETKFGISKRSYPNVDIKNLTESDAIQIYTRDYWNRLRASEIHDQTVANTVFRYAVHSGVVTSARLLQRTLNKFLGVSVAVDGKIGPASLAAVNSLEPVGLDSALRIAIVTHYRDIVTSRPSQSKFLLGWVNRVLK